jgi:acetyltransferase-like isoleucine patch superfamily enzyme
MIIALPTMKSSRTANIGRGCVIYPHCFIGLNARVGDVVFALSGCVINHDDVIGDRVTLASRAALAGEVTVEPDCYLGQGCLIREKLTIGHGSLIGMGAVVVEDVLPNSVMAGNPARRLRDRT